MQKRSIRNNIVASLQISAKDECHLSRCDLCGTCSVVGARFKCKVCEQYVLCGPCKVRVEHDFMEEMGRYIIYYKLNYF